MRALPFTAVAAATGLLLAATGAAAQTAPAPAPAPDSLAAAIVEGGPIVDVRARYESVNQANLEPLGQAFSTRVQLGWQTASFHGFQVLAEFAGVFHADGGDYNVAIPGGASLNGKTAFPIINDPSFATLNRAQIAWSPDRHVKITVGRQRVLIDDQRFVGNSGWRQDEQRFDAARADLSLGRLTGTYVYVWRVDRTFGGRLDWNSDSHLVNLAYDVGPPLRLEGFVYALDFSNAGPTALANAAINASFTGGVRAIGKAKAGPVRLAYHATWARQTDYRGRTAPFALDFWQAGLAATYGVATARLDFEQLGGDGQRGFTTPIATTHAFQGWADAFAANGGNKTGVDGLRDFNGAVTLSPPWKLGFLSHPQAVLRYHAFRTVIGDAALAHEWDAQLQAQVSRRLTAQFTWASFQRVSAVPDGVVPAPPSRTKFWLSLEYKL